MLSFKFQGAPQDREPFQQDAKLPFALRKMLCTTTRTMLFMGLLPRLELYGLPWSKQVGVASCDCGDEFYSFLQVIPTKGSQKYCIVDKTMIQ